MNIETMPAGEYLRLIESGEPFAQANYGDGEWGCILGDDGVNCDGTRYEPELRDALRKTLSEPSGYWCGTNPGRKLQARVAEFVPGHVSPDIRWIYKETVSGENVNGRFAPFLAAFRERLLIIVGGEHLRELPRQRFGSFAFAAVHPTDSWRTAGDTVDMLRKAITHAMKPPLVLFAAGMGSNLMISELWADDGVRAAGATLLDVGATLDPYVGVFSRNAYRKEKFQTRELPKNLGVMP